MSLAPLLTGIQTAFNTKVLQNAPGAKLPFVADHLKDLPATQVFTDLRDLVKPKLDDLMANPTTDQITQALRDGFGALIQGQIVTAGDVHQFTWDLHLNQALTDKGPISFDAGLDAIGLSAAAIQVNLQAGYQFHFKFGVNETQGLFVDVSDPNDLTYTLNATASTTGVGGHLGAFFTISVNSNSSTFQPVFTVNFTGPSGDIVPFTNIATLNARGHFSGDAHIRLGLGLGFANQAVDVRLRTNLSIDWSFNNADPQARLQDLGNTPDVKFDAIQLDLKAFVGSYLHPIVDRVNHVFQPFAKVVDILSRPLPGFDKLTSSPPSFLDLMLALTSGNKDYFDAVKQVAIVAQTLADLAIPENTWIDLGLFSFTANGQDARRITGPDQVHVNTVSQPPTPPLDQAKNQGGARFFQAAQVDLKGGGMHFAILEDPKSAVPLLFGQAVDLLTFQTPTLQAHFRQEVSYQVVFPPLVPIYVKFGGGLDLTASAKFGFDTSGLATGNILDGFFVDLRGNPALFTVRAGVGVTGGLGLDLGSGGIFKVNVTLGGAGLNLTGTVNFEPRNLPADQKLRFPQIQQEWDQGLGAIFMANGNVSLHAEFFAEASVTIGKDPFAVHIGIHQKLAGFDKVLFDFSSLGVENTDQAPPMTVHWVGPGSDWNNAQNWDTHAVPRSVDDVVIGQGSVVLNGAATVHGLALTGGTLAGSGTLTVTGPTTWTGGTMAGTGTTVAGGGLALSGDARKTLDGRHLQDGGSSVWKDNGEVYADNGAVWDNLSGGTLDLQTSAGLYQGPGAAAVFNNRGRLLRSAGAGGFDFDIALNDTGRLDVNAGTLIVERHISTVGTVTVAAGAALAFEGDAFTQEASSSIGGAGTVTFDVPGTVTLAGTYTVSGATDITNGTVVFPRNAGVGGLSLRGGGIGVDQRLTITDTLVWVDGGVSGSGTLAANGGAALSGPDTKWINGVTWANAGTTVWAGSGPLLFVDGATFDNLATGVLDAQGDAPMVFTAGQATALRNAGVFKKSAGTGFTYVGTAITNVSGGAVQALAGTLVFGAGGTSAGAFTVNAPGAALYLDDGTYTLTNGASLGGTGVTQISGAVVNITGSVTAQNWQVDQGTVNVSGSLTETGNGAVGGASAALTVSGTWTGGRLTLGVGTVTITNTATVSVTYLLESSGSLSTAGTTTAQTLDLAGGTLTATGVTSAGALHQLGGTLTGSGAVTLTGTGSTWTAGTMSGTGATVIASEADLTISGAVAKTLDGRPLRNAGTITWTDGTITGSNGATVNNPAGATFVMMGGTFLQGAGAAVVFTNAGTFRKTGTAVATINAVFNHSGTADIQAGALYLGGGGTHTAEYPVAAGAFLYFSGGVHTVSAVVRGAGDAGVSGGAATFGAAVTTATFNVSGTANPDHTYSGGTAILNGPVTVTGFGVGPAGTATLNAAVTAQGVLVAGGTGEWACDPSVGCQRDVFYAIPGGTATLNAALTATSLEVEAGQVVWDPAFFVDGVARGGQLTVGSAGSVQVQTATLGGATSHVNAPVLVAAGVLDATGPVQTRDFALAGRLAGSGVLTATGASTWSMGFMEGTGTTLIPAGATLLIEAPQGVAAPFSLTQRTLRLGGAASWTRGGIDGTAGATVDILSGGSLDVPAPDSANGTLPNVVNAGQMHVGRKAVAIGTLTNTGTLTVAATGSVTVTTLTNTGTLDVDANGSVTATTLTNLSGTTLTGGTFLLRGQLGLPSVDIHTNAATVVLDGTSAGIFESQPPRRDGFRNLTNNTAAGRFTFTDRGFSPVADFSNAGVVTFGGAGTLYLYGVTWTNTGQFFWTGGGYITMANGATFNNQSGATFDAQNDAVVNTDYSACAFNNAGTLIKSAGAGATRFAAGPGGSFNNSGTVSVLSGTLSGAGTSTGRFAVAAGATLNLAGQTLTAMSSVSGAGQVTFTGGATLNGSFSATGAVTISNGIVTFNTDATLTSLTLDDQVGGTLGGTGTVTVTGLLTWMGGGMSGTGVTNANGGLAIGGGYTKYLSQRTLNNAATATWTGTGNITMMNAGTTFNNLAGATFDAQNDAVVNNGGGAATAFNNAGTFTKSAGSGVTTIGSGQFNNSGTVSVLSGTLYLSNGFANFSNRTLTGGTYLVSGSGVLKFASADIRTNAATIVLDGATAAITDQSGNNALANFATNAATGSFTVQNGRTFTTAADFTNAGTLVVGPGSTFTVTGTYAQDGTATVQAGGTLSLQGPFSNFDPSSGTLTGGTYQIAGLFQFSDAATTPIATNAATLTLDGPAAQVTDLAGNDALGGSLLANASGAGLTLLNGASLNLAADFSNAGTLTVGAGSTFDTPGVYSQTDGLTTLAGGMLQADGLVDLEGGLLNGAGTLQGTVLNNAAIDVGQPGSPGVLTITGDYSGSGTLVIEIGGTNPGSDFDQLLIGGQATFAGGTLTINLINGFVPDPTNPDSFQVLTFSAHDPADDFAAYNGLDLGGGLSLMPSYDGGSLTLVATSNGGAPGVPGQAPRDDRPAATEAETPAAACPASEPAALDRFFAGVGGAHRPPTFDSINADFGLRSLADVRDAVFLDGVLGDPGRTPQMRAQ